MDYCRNDQYYKNEIREMITVGIYIEKIGIFREKIGGNSKNYFLNPFKIG